MSTWSKTHTVKSNAAREAVKYGLSRADVVPGEDGGFRFMIPDGKAVETIVAEPTAPDAPLTVSEATFITKAIPETGGAIVDPFDGTGTDDVPPAPAVRAAIAKTARRKSKDPKPKKTTHGKFVGSPAFQGRKTSGGRSGVIAKVVGELRKKWTPADDILKETGWVSNTFRGVLGKCRKDGMDVRMEKRDGKTCYRIAA